MRETNTLITFYYSRKKPDCPESRNFFYRTIYLFVNYAMMATSKKPVLRATKRNRILTFCPASVILLLSLDAHTYFYVIRS
jgi:hypothetical protein